MQNVTKVLLTTALQEGQILSVVGDTYRLVVTGEQTGGDYAMIEMLVPPGLSTLRPRPYFFDRCR
ncbi:hypothetical protein [Spirosoma arcticum]